MRLHLAIVLALLMPLQLAAQTRIGRGVVTGQVLDGNAHPLPGVTVTTTAPGFLDVSTRTDERGEFRLTTAPEGATLVTAEMGGFFSSTAPLMLDASEPRRVTLTLWVRPWEDTTEFINADADFFADATAVAHIRIVSTLEPRPCNESNRARHAAIVLSTAKGTLPLSIWIENTVDLFCYSPDRVEYDIPQWSVGDEFIAFLKQRGDVFVGVQGSATIFKVNHGKVEVRGVESGGLRNVPFRTGDSVSRVWQKLQRSGERQKK